MKQAVGRQRAVLPAAPVPAVTIGYDHVEYDRVAEAVSPQWWERRATAVGCSAGSAGTE